MSLSIPVKTKGGKLPLNLPFTPNEYQSLLMQRLQVYLSDEEVMLGSMGSEPAFNAGPWFHNGTWSVWNNERAKYVPVKIGFLNADKTAGTTLSADLSSDRTIQMPDASGTVATLNDLYVPRSFRALGYFEDGVADGDTGFGSNSARFDVTDEGLSIVGNYIQNDTTIVSVNSSTDVTLSKATTASITTTSIPFAIQGRTAHIIDASKSFEFFGVLSGNTTIFPIIEMPVSREITIILMNASTSFTVIWPTAGADNIGWGSVPHTMPTANAGELAIGIFKIRELDVNITTHLWGRADLDFSVSSGIVDPGDPASVLPIGQGPPYGTSGGPYHIP